jgi:anti-anti-sigma factor
MRLIGNLTHEGAYKLQAEFVQLLQKGCVALVLDFEQVTFIDSTGIGMLLLMSAECQRVGGGLALSGTSSAVAKILKVATRNLVFRVHDDIESAFDEVETRMQEPKDDDDEKAPSKLKRERPKSANAPS